MITSTCARHGAYISRTSECPTCREIEAARDVLRNGRGRGPAHRRARALLEYHGQRGTGHREPESFSFDLGGAA